VQRNKKRLAKTALERCERQIEKGLAQFLIAGSALRRIRDQKLYQPKYGPKATFETYCLKRWGFSRAHAYRLIEAADVQARLSPNGDIKLPSEAVARALLPLKDNPKALRAAWTYISDTVKEKITADVVRETVQDILDGHKDRKPVPPSEKSRLDRKSPLICPKCRHEFYAGA
jgi:hypothetical protein